MKISEEERWLFQYSLPCHYGDKDLFEKSHNLDKIKKKLGINPTKKDILDHFFIVHNLDTLKEGPMQYSHLVIPYSIGEFNGKDIICKINKPFHELPQKFNIITIHDEVLREAKDQGILELSDIENIIKEDKRLVIHENYIVDVLEKKDIIKYHELWI